MGPRNYSSFQSHNYFHRLSKALEFAVSEWLLMFLLFIDACFAFLIAKFASYCQLKGPCLMCSRFDHVLAKDKKGIYWDSICNHHKSEISSVVLSHVHETNETNGFVDGFLEPLKSPNMEKNETGVSSNFDYQKVSVNSDSESEHIENSRDFIPEILLKSDSQSQVLDLQNGLQTIVGDDAEVHKCQIDENKEDTIKIIEQISIDEVSSSNFAETPTDLFQETTKPIKDPVTEPEISATTNGHQQSNHLDLGDAYKLAISTNGRQLSEKLLEQKSFQDSSTRVNEDIKLLLSYRSNDNLISPKPSLNSDDLSGIQFLQRRISLERNESNLSIDGSVVSEIEGESLVDRLKRQVEHDKKILGVLYKELEEERNASAVATNQAMAMITRLQEEKAALYTEALQCLRVMEEQAEYNNEALQKANDVIEEKEKLILDLEEIVRNMNQD